MTDRSLLQSVGPGKVAWGALGFLALFTFLAIGGYRIFALQPNLIPDSEFARAMYGVSFKLFARVHILLAALVLGIFLSRQSGTRWVPAFFAVAFTSFLSEYIGTGYGIPFSGYEYTNLLGYKLGGRVPLVIPISWFLMALPSWVLARWVFPSSRGRIGRILFASYLLTAWDLALDPAMSFLTPYWVWENKGPFYGMPWINLAGWMGTGMVLMVVLELLGAKRWAEGLELKWVMAYYGVVLLMPLGMMAAAGLWGGVAVTALALFLAWGIGGWIRGRQAEHGVGAMVERQAA